MGSLHGTTDGDFAIQRAGQPQAGGNHSRNRKRHRADFYRQIEAATYPPLDADPSAINQNLQSSDVNLAIGQRERRRPGQGHPVVLSTGRSRGQLDPWLIPGRESAPGLDILLMDKRRYGQIDDTRPADGGQAKLRHPLAGGGYAIGGECGVDLRLSQRRLDHGVALESCDGDIGGTEICAVGIDAHHLTPILDRQRDIGGQGAGDTGKQQGRKVVEIAGHHRQRPDDGVIRGDGRGTLGGHRPDFQVEVFQPKGAVRLAVHPHTTGRRLAVDIPGQGHGGAQRAGCVLDRGQAQRRMARSIEPPGLKGEAQAVRRLAQRELARCGQARRRPQHCFAHIQFGQGKLLNQNLQRQFRQQRPDRCRCGMGHPLRRNRLARQFDFADLQGLDLQPARKERAPVPDQPSPIEVEPGALPIRDHDVPHRGIGGQSSLHGANRHRGVVAGEQAGNQSRQKPALA